MNMQTVFSHLPWNNEMIVSITFSQLANHLFLSFFDKLFETGASVHVNNFYTKNKLFF